MLRVVETFRATSATTALEDRDPTALLNSPPAIPTEVTMRPIGLVVVLTLSLTIPQSLLIRANEIIY